jgi:F-box and leucine-rich repeat protein 2/20
VSHCKKITDKGLVTVASRCHNLRSLCLTGCRLVTDSLLQTLSRDCLKLEELVLSSCPKITDSGLCHLSEGPHHIKTIDVSKCTNVGDLGVGKIISSSAESLVSVKLLDCYKVTDVTVFALAKSCPNLEILVIGGCYDVTDESLRALVVGCGENIKSLRLDGCEKLTDLSLKTVISKCKNLVALDIGSCDKVTDVTFKTLIKNEFDSKLKVLKANHVGFTLMGIHIISKFCKEMEYIDLRSCPYFSRIGYDIADIRFPSGCRVNFDGSWSIQEMVETYF